LQRVKKASCSNHIALHVHLHVIIARSSNIASVLHLVL
jgi:hypothetical protein